MAAWAEQVADGVNRGERRIKYDQNPPLSPYLVVSQRIVLWLTGTYLVTEGFAKVLSGADYKTIASFRVNGLLA
jgi:hypothetical protein